MSSAYITMLNQGLAQQATSKQQAPPYLHTRFIEWNKGLPEIARNRPFAMIELEQALCTQGKYLSPILLSLEWQRKRKWNGDGQYPRY